MKEKDLVEYLVRSLVDYPDSVQVKIVEGKRSSILELTVLEKDIGKVIGKHGRIISAIRVILSACATKSNRRVILEIID